MCYDSTGRYFSLPAQSRRLAGLRCNGFRPPSQIEEYSMNALEWNEAALAKYLSTHPTLKDEISQLSAAEQKQQLQWAFEDEAESRGIEP